MRYPKWFARWRLQVWDNRLTDARKEWNRASVIGPVVDAVSPVASSETLEQFWERQVTKAMVKRVLWRKRLGIKPLSGGPVKPRPDLPYPGPW